MAGVVGRLMAAKAYKEAKQEQKEDFGQYGHHVRKGVEFVQDDNMDDLVSEESQRSHRKPGKVSFEKRSLVDLTHELFFLRTDR